MGFRVAKSLLALRDQVDASAPHRDKSSDGTIGDLSHQSRKSDHNPIASGVVTAMDITNDPAHGVVARDIAEMLRISQDLRIKYVISIGKFSAVKILRGNGGHTQAPMRMKSMFMFRLFMSRLFTMTRSRGAWTFWPRQARCPRHRHRPIPFFQYRSHGIRWACRSQYERL